MVACARADRPGFSARFSSVTDMCEGWRQTGGGRRYAGSLSIGFCRALNHLTIRTTRSQLGIGTKSWKVLHPLENGISWKEPIQGLRRKGAMQKVSRRQILSTLA